MADYIDSMILPTSAKLKRGRYTDKELDKLRQLAAEGARDPEAVADAVFFPVVASANTIDSYGTFMMPSTLKNFATDATAGVAVLDSHNSNRLNFGMSVTGEYVQDGEIKAFLSDFYTIPGIQTEGLSTDSYIKGIQAGLFRDISVGFWMPPGSILRCTVCGKDMMRWYAEDGCSHFPGMEYDVEADGKTRREYAYGAVEEGRLSEYSTVHDGATPGAGVAKARHMEDNGELDPNIALRLERAYHTSFPRATRKFQGYALIGDNDMSLKTKRAQDDEAVIVKTTADDAVVEGAAPEGAENPIINPDVGTEPTVITPVQLEPETRVDDDVDQEEETGERAIEKSELKFTKRLRDALNDRYSADGIKIGERVSDAVTALADEIKNLRSQLVEKETTNRTLENEAKIGRTYRKDLIDELKREVIRSADADKEDVDAKAARYVRLAEAADIEEIKGLRDDFANAARAKYGAGRRTFDNDAEEGVEKKPAPLSPNVYDDLPA